MLKVSFKGDYRHVSVQDRTTKVDLIGTCVVPENLWTAMIMAKVFDHENALHIDADQQGVLHLRVTGYATRHPDDNDNPVVAKRIAESRAKIKLYKFMIRLCVKVTKYHYNLVYGNYEIGSLGESHTEEPKDCLWITVTRYRRLWLTESHHLDQLLLEV